MPKLPEECVCLLRSVFRAYELCFVFPMIFPKLKAPIAASAPLFPHTNCGAVLLMHKHEWAQNTIA